MYFNEELQKTLPSGKPKYYKDGEVFEYDFNAENSRYDSQLANEFSRFNSILKTHVWDIEYGPGGSDDVRVNWKRDEDGKISLPT